MKYLDKFAKYFTNVLLFLVITAILFALYSLIQLTTLQKDYVNYFGYTVFEVESGSMAPTINVRDVIVVKIGDKDVKKGDIITYKKDDDFITHRVVEVGGDKLITKGDSNNSDDKIVQKDEILGKIVKTFPRLGVWKEILLSPTVIIVIFVTLMIFSLGCAYNGKNKEKEKNEKSNTKNKKKNDKEKPIVKEIEINKEPSYDEKQKNEHIKEVVKQVKEDKKKYVDNDFEYNDIKERVKSLKETKKYVDDIDDEEIVLPVIEEKKIESDPLKKKDKKNRYKYNNQYKYKGKYNNKNKNKKQNSNK